jgi:AraC-like DNA-binding protein
VESWEPHSVAALPGGASVVIALISADLLAEVGRSQGTALGAPTFPVAVRRDATLRGALLTLAEAARRPVPRLATDVAAAETAGALVALLHAASGVSPDAEDRGGARAAVRRAVEYLHAHMADDVSLDDLAAAAHLSKYHFARTFRRLVGCPPHAYQLRVRLGHARRLLLGGAPGGRRGAGAQVRGPEPLHARVPPRLRRAPGPVCTSTPRGRNRKILIAVAAFGRRPSSVRGHAEAAVNRRHRATDAARRDTATSGARAGSLTVALPALPTAGPRTLPLPRRRSATAG